MTYTTFFDLVLRPCHDDIPAWDRMGGIWRIVHVAGKRSGVLFAVAFPGWMREGFCLGNTLRVFVSGPGGAELLYDAIDTAPGVQDLVEGLRVRSIKAAPAAFEAYLMRRIPSGVSKTRKTLPADVELDLHARARQRRLAQQQGLPYVRMRSSTGNGFRLVIERVHAQGTEDGVPNGYGLSRATQIIALPVVD